MKKIHDINNELHNHRPKIVHIYLCLISALLETIKRAKPKLVKISNTDKKTTDWLPSQTVPTRDLKIWSIMYQNKEKKAWILNFIQ